MSDRYTFRTSGTTEILIIMNKGKHQRSGSGSRSGGAVWQRLVIGHRCAVIRSCFRTLTRFSRKEPRY
jgi:hypothetical protein